MSSTEIYQDGGFLIEHHTNGCGDGDCWGHTGTCITVRPALEHYQLACFHAKRFWSRNRSITECVAAALTFIRERQLAQLREAQEAQLAKDEVRALADVVSGLLGSR